MKKTTYIQEYSIRGGQDEHSGEETKRSGIMVKGDNPEQELWDTVLGEISAGYEQRLFVNDNDYDIVGDDESIEELREAGMEAGRHMSDQTDYRIEERVEKPTVEQIKAAVLRYLDGKFEAAEVVDDYRKTVVDGLQASYTTKEELRADIERIFEEGEDFFSGEK